MKSKTVRLPERLVQAVNALRGDNNFSEVMKQAVAEWVDRRRRKQADDAIAHAAAERSADQIAGETSLIQQAGDSARRLMDHGDG
ncbi:MAG: hypothetical protein ACE5GE_15400 [Phycisphaerae bacterium]